MRGTDPSLGNEIDEESCAIAWLPMLLTENAKASHGTGAAVESFSSEAVKNHHELLSVAMQASQLVPFYNDAEGQQAKAIEGT